MSKVAMISGISGQDGSYLTELLISKGYQVHGIVRRTSNPDRSNIAHLQDQITLHSGDVTDLGSLVRILQKVQPAEVYNLAAQSFVMASFDSPSTTADIVGHGCLNMLEAIRLTSGNSPRVRFYQASSSEMFGQVRTSPQTEDTPFYPRSPYGVSKAFAHWMTIHYREAHNLFACSGILFNHESPRRGPEFVTRKITQAAANIAYGNQTELLLGNLDAERDWGHARDYVQAMWLMLQQEQPDDFVICTGIKHTVREFAELAFQKVGLDYTDYVRVDPALHRPTEVVSLCGHFGKARQKLDWMPQCTFNGLVQEMVNHDRTLLRRSR